MDKLKVYFAGGMASNWQHQLTEHFGNKFIYYNPSDHKLADSTQYTVWDLFFVQKSDILFAYMESNNPSGYGLTLEVGFAKALNKTIILVDERSSHDAAFANRFKIVRESASVVFDSLEHGMNYLNSFVQIV